MSQARETRILLMLKAERGRLDRHRESDCLAFYRVAQTFGIPIREIRALREDRNA